MNTIARTLGAAVLAAGLSVPAVAAEVTELNFGIISTESQQNLRKQWDPFLADMQEQIGIQVKPFFATDYAGVIEGMRFGKVDVAWHGNKSAMEAVDRANGEVFVQTVAADGSPGYWSLILAPKDSPLNSVEDLLKCDKSLNFGIGDPNSASGFLVPMTFVFAANGVDPKSCFKTVRNANHETNALAVANRQVDAAANNTENLERIRQTNPAAFDKIKVIWKSALIPSDPIVWRKDLPEDVKEKLKTFFLTYGTDQSSGDVAHEKEVLAGLGWAPFRPSTDAQLLPIRIMELAKTIAQTEADESLSAEAKKAKIDELEARKASFQAELDAQPQG
jgi:phosphonate transport system substrate-binding protein